MKRIHIIGGKNHGKTTLVSQLVVEFRSRGLRVGTIKHTHHHHELDTPGKDSHHHREAGATAVGILSPAMNAVFWPNPEQGSAPDEADWADRRYERFTAMFECCDLVLVEGDMQAIAPKIEVWRAALERPPLCSTNSSICALVTHDLAPVAVPILPRADVPGIADFILQHLGE